MVTMPKASFAKPMSVGDSTLMMLLSLNLLLLVFFMLLNSMATYSDRHASEVLAKVREGYDLPGPAMNAESNLPEVPTEAWRAGIVTRLQGITLNRIELRVLPQQGSANKVEVTLPLSAVFDAQGQIIAPEFLRNLASAAGPESTVKWQIVGTWKDADRYALMAAALATETGEAEFTEGSEQLVRVTVVPGAATRPQMGLQVQDVGEAAGAAVRGLDEKAVPRE